MADNITTTNTGTGALPNGTVIATRDSGSGQWQQVDVGPATCTPVSGGQYALSVGTGSHTTLTVPATATHCFLSVDTGGGNVRWTQDGSNPTSTAGHLLQAGDAVELSNLSAVKIIGITSTATCQVSYHKYV